MTRNKQRAMFAKLRKDVTKGVPTEGKMMTKYGPFRGSVEKRVLYHASNKKFTEFKEPKQGIYLTPMKEYAKAHYGKYLYSTYANVRKMYTPTQSERDLFYMREYKKIDRLIKKLTKKGYDSVKFGGESESMVLFNNPQIVNARTGRGMTPAMRKR